jgi:hypothetical protein
LKAAYKIETRQKEASVLESQKAEFGPEFSQSPLECAKALTRKTPA